LAADLSFAVTQDKQGFIWIGTDRGLQRYDGKRFITFRKKDNDPSSISSNAVSSLFTDKKGLLWIILFGNQVGYMNTSTFRFTPVNVNVPEEFKKSASHRFIEDPEGRLHISVLGYSVLTYDEKKNEFNAEKNNIKFADGSLITEINNGRTKGSYYISSQKGFDHYNSITNQWDPRNSDGLLINMNKVMQVEGTSGPGHFFIDKKGRAWSDAWLDNKKEAGPQVYCYDPADKSWNTYKQSVDLAAGGYHSLNGFLEQKNGAIWLYGTGIFARFNEEKKIFEDVRNESLKLNGIDLETIYQLYEDKDENIWMSTSNGLFMFNPGKQVFYNYSNRRGVANEAYARNSIESVMQAKNGTIFSSTWGAGIFAYDKDMSVAPNTIIPVIPDNNGLAVWDMLERENGEMWLAEQGGSIRVHDPKKGKTIKLKLAIFEGKTVRQLAEDSIGNMWMGTQYGLVIKCTNANWRDTVHSFKVVLNVKGRVTKLFTDRQGFLWVGTDKYGLYRLNANNGSIVAHYNDEAPAGRRLQLPGANDILQYNDSIFLIASGDLNILNIKNNSITYAGAGGGIEHSALASILMDRQGYIWMAFSDGLGRMEFGKHIFLYFDEEEGILNSHFQINAATLLQDGRILLGTTTDLLMFDPLKISFPNKAAPVKISGFMQADQELQVDSLLRLKKIILPYYNNTFTIDLTTFSYQNDNAILYTLENVDSKWLPTKNNRIVYNRLAPGTYIFKAKSVSATGAESEVTQLVIEIVPPFWETWWFYGLLILSGLLVFYLIDRERVMRLKSTQKLRTEIALSLHHDVNTTLNNINLLSEMARMKADKDISKTKDLIEQISEKSNDMIIAMDDMLWVIDPTNDSMEKTVFRMNEFIDSLRNRHEADIEIHIDEKVKDMKLDMKLRHGFFVIFKSALRCMVQYSGSKQTLVNIDLLKNQLMLKMHG
ncbi:MAG TPA: two-component regulator propeller domain-containing protein, partial [Ferruginibacter sp.]|nr:two-component regulator propeller domain-containing protein [Ferruginibacter sp.]